MSFIYDKIEQQLFERDEDKVNRYEVYMAQDNISVDSLDPEQDLGETGKEPQPWIIEQLVSLASAETSIAENEDGTPNLQAAAMKNELLDLIELDYFKCAMQDSFRDTFTHCIESENGLVQQIFDEGSDEEGNPKIVEAQKLYSIVLTFYNLTNPENSLSKSYLTELINERFFKSKSLRKFSKFQFFDDEQYQKV